MSIYLESYDHPQQPLELKLASRVAQRKAEQAAYLAALPTKERRKMRQRFARRDQKFEKELADKRSCHWPPWLHEILRLMHESSCRQWIEIYERRRLSGL
jgi:hypothetical protein